MGENEASPRPWRISSDSAQAVVDANGRLLFVTYSSTAALIVAVVNAEWERAQVGKAMVEQWNAGVVILKPCQRDPVCDQRAGHEGPCRYEFPAGPPAAVPGSFVNVEATREGALQKRINALPDVRSDCRLPLEHRSGCQCAALLR